MGLSLTRKPIETHLMAGKPVAGEESGVRIDQILRRGASAAHRKRPLDREAQDRRLHQ